MSDKKDLSLYVHIPYCKKKCLYCDFVSYDNKFSTADKYCETVIDELSQYDLNDYKINTIFFGGGTPSSVNPKIILNILEEIVKKCDVYSDAEITIECNPHTADKRQLGLYRSSGINRLSVGAQSFDNGELKTLGRLHDADAAKRCVYDAKDSGFRNVNVDLMFAVPTQSEDSLAKSLNECALLDVSHISLYSLILEEGTALKKEIDEGRLEKINDDDDRTMYRLACKTLQDQGYLQYEISNFAKKGFECRHNAAYWERKEYIGIGCAAHSFFNGARYSNPNVLERYLQGVDTANNILNGEKIDKLGAAEEIVMLGLRMNKGISIRNFVTDTGFDIRERCYDALSKLKSQGLIEINGDRIYTTDAGRDVLNYIILQITSEF